MIAWKGLAPDFQLFLTSPLRNIPDNPSIKESSRYGLQVWRFWFSLILPFICTRQFFGGVPPFDLSSSAFDDTVPVAQHEENDIIGQGDDEGWQSSRLFDVTVSSYRNKVQKHSERGG
jgi:hypothetical protein